MLRKSKARFIKGKFPSPEPMLGVGIKTQATPFQV
jgi:hypothetical protein